MHDLTDNAELAQLSAIFAANKSCARYQRESGGRDVRIGCCLRDDHRLHNAMWADVLARIKNQGTVPSAA